MVLVHQRWLVQIYLKIMVYHKKILQWLIEVVSFTEEEKKLNQWKSAHAIETSDRTLKDAIKNADVFLGLICKRCLTKDMVKKMAKKSNYFCLCKSRSRNYT